MARDALARERNAHGHKYRPDPLTKTYICSVCGTCERRSGIFWWAGKWSRQEPPCGFNTVDQREWHHKANPDNEN